jgi:hypothetical protein
MAAAVIHSPSIFPGVRSKDPVMLNSDKPDRRRTTRYSAPMGISVHIRTPASKFGGFLIDLGINGAAFEYVFLDEAIAGGHLIDICSDRDRLCIQDLPFKLVSDFEVSDPEPEPVVWRRAGIAFTDLSKAHRRQLTQLIRQWGHEVSPTMAAVPVMEPAPAAGVSDLVFLARLKLLNVSAKAYLRGYPYGFYRENAASRNAKEILRLLPTQNVFRFSEAHGPLLEKHIIRLSTAFSEFPVKSDGAASLEDSIDYISDHLRVDNSLKQMAFLKVA